MTGSHAISLKTLEDAKQTSMPKAMRDLFTVLLLNIELADPRDLWEKFKDPMSEDFLRHERSLYNNPQLAINENHHNKALIYINERLGCYSKHLCDFNLPTPSVPVPVDSVIDNNEIRQQLQFDVNEQRLLSNELQSQLNRDQKLVFDHISNSLEGNPASSLTFVDAPGGTGKTFLINCVLSTVRAEGHIAIAVASSGIAATLLPVGTTAHSRFKIPIDIHSQSFCNIEKNSRTAELLRQAKIIVWDECPMIHKHCFEAVDRTLRDIRGIQHPFGGIVMLCSGDFRQLLPVVKRGSDADIINSCIKSSYLWRQFKIFKLHANMRVGPEEHRYAEYVLAIGEDKIPKSADGDIVIPPNLLLNATTMEECVDYIYPTFANPADIFCNNAVLVPLNNMVRQINDHCIDRFPGVKKTYKSFNSVCDSDAVQFPTEFLDGIELSGLPPHKLELKINSPIMLMRNLDPPRLCNGTRLIVQQLLDNIIVAKIISGSYKNDVVMIPRIAITLSDGTDTPLRRVQFPVQSCFAMTIHKAQGQTISNILIYLEKPVFQHGQLYVGLSRAKCPNNIKIFIPDEGNLTKNVVLPNVI